ncbi:hypothetical protein HDU76_011027, partial [Blyttiomyces sp. JEL0837]
LVHAISGFMGELIEDAYIGTVNCELTNPIFAYLLLFNEINWTLHESSTVYYSFIKTRIVIINKTVEKAMEITMIVLFVAFVALRANIARLRFTHNVLMDDDIRTAHSYAYIAWGFADLVVLVLLVWNVLDQMRNLSNAGGRMVKTLMHSSVPRIGVIFINTLCIVITSYIESGDTTLQNFSVFLWLVKGTYPIILLLDILMTRFLLYNISDHEPSKPLSHKHTTPTGNYIEHHDPPGISLELERKKSLGRTTNALGGGNNNNGVQRSYPSGSDLSGGTIGNSYSTPTTFQPALVVPTSPSQSSSSHMNGWSISSGSQITQNSRTNSDSIWTPPTTSVYPPAFSSTGITNINNNSSLEPLRRNNSLEHRQNVDSYDYADQQGRRNGAGNGGDSNGVLPRFDTSKSQQYYQNSFAN